MLEPGRTYHHQTVLARLNPGARAAALLFNYTTAVNAAYNQILYRAKNDYQTYLATGGAEGKTLPVFSAYALETHLTAVKGDWFDWADQVPAAVFTDAAHRVAAAFTRMAKKQSRYPRFRKRRSETDAGKQSVTFKKKPSDRWLADDGRAITVPVAAARRAEFGLSGNDALWVPVARDKRVWRATKLIRAGRAQIQKVTFSFKGGYWWAAIALRVDDRNRTQHTPDPALYQGGRVGVDVAFGNRALVLSRVVPGLTDDLGAVAAPHHLRRLLGRLAALAAAYQFTEPGSRNRARLLGRLRKTHHRVAAERRRWHHQVANWLVAAFDDLVIEDLNIKGMATRKKGGRYSYGLSVADLAPAQLADILGHKAARYGRTLTHAHSLFPSSKQCSNPDCGAVKAKLPPSVRTYVCAQCGLVADRDVNAARNLEAYDSSWRPARRTTRASSAGAPAMVPKGEGSSVRPAGARASAGVCV